MEPRSSGLLEWLSIEKAPMEFRASRCFIAVAELHFALVPPNGCTSTSRRCPAPSRNWKKNWACLSWRTTRSTITDPEAGRFFIMPRIFGGGGAGARQREGCAQRLSWTASHRFVRWRHLRACRRCWKRCRECYPRFRCSCTMRRHSSRSGLARRLCGDAGFLSMADNAATGILTIPVVGG